MTKYFDENLLHAQPGDLLTATRGLRRRWYVKARNADGSYDIEWAWYLEPWLHVGIGLLISVFFVSALALIAGLL